MAIARRLYQFLYTVYFKFIVHNGFLLAAGIAFFIFFSLFPLLLLVATVIGYILEAPDLQQQIVNSVFAGIPDVASYVETDVIRPMIQSRSIAGIIAILGLVWAGIGFFGGLASGLNAIYEVKETRHFVFMRVWALIVSLIIIALFIVSVLASSFASVLRDNVFALLFPEQVATFAWVLVSVLISLASTVFLFYVVYRLVPSAKLPWRSLWMGTLTAGITWEFAKYLFNFYLNTFASRSYGLVYGSLATIVLFMFWLYISSVLLLVGAEINAEHNRRMVGEASGGQV